MYLHVITYNMAAWNFYIKNGFKEMGTLTNFYHIKTGRALHADETNYDAYLLLKLQNEQHTVDMNDLVAPGFYAPRAGDFIAIKNSWCTWILRVQKWCNTLIQSAWQAFPSRKKYKKEINAEENENSAMLHREMERNPSMWLKILFGRKKKTFVFKSIDRLPIEAAM